MRTWRRRRRCPRTRHALLGAAVLLLADIVASGCATPPADAHPGSGSQGSSSARGGGAPTTRPASTNAANIDQEADVIGLERAFAGVALLLADLPDGRTRYGAALVLDARGHALTSLHVVDGASRVRAMLYRAGRISYTPMDGGIARLVAENAADLTVAAVLQREHATDLAVVSLGADTSRLPLLEISEQLPGPGARVVAIGHPHEAVWSSTAGMLSSRRDGLVQHDAPLGVGSSGGPLLDARGRVLGVNTVKVFGDSEGLAFARPMALARSLLQQAGVTPAPPPPSAR